GSASARETTDAHSRSRGPAPASFGRELRRAAWLRLQPDVECPSCERGTPRSVRASSIHCSSFHKLPTHDCHGLSTEDDSLSGNPHLTNATSGGCLKRPHLRSAEALAPEGAKA